MPLVTAAVLAYAAGLIAGFGGPFAWTSTAIVLVVCYGGRTGRDRWLLAVVAAAGWTTAHIGRQAESRCADRLLSAGGWRLTLLADASPGAFVPSRTPQS